MKFLDKTGLDTLWAKIKSWFARKENGVYYVVGTHSYTAYSTSATYTKYTSGAYTSANSCVYNGVAYYCSTAITTPEAWTSSHWTKIATPTWEGTIDGVTELVAGLKISYKIPIAGGQSSTYLNINNLGNKYVKRCTGQTTTHLPVNTVVFMTYDGTQWVWADYSVGDNYYVIPDVYCTTSAGTQAKAATSIGFNHDRHKNIPFRIYFTNTNSYNGNLTLNINSQGAKALWINGSASSSSNKTISVGVYWCYFDGTQYQLWTDKTMPSPIAVRGPVVTRTFTSVSKVTDDTRWRRVARLKFGNEYNFCYVTLLVNNFFWNGQQKSSHLLYIACNNDGSQSTTGVVNCGKIKLMGDDIVFKIDRTNLGSAIASANRYADLYLQYPTSGNGSGDWSVSVLNISNHAFDKIEWANNSETSQTLPEDCVEIELAGQISSAATATKATQDSDGNAINATYFKANTSTTTLQSGTAVKVGTQNGADVKLQLPTIPAAANNGALKIGLNGGTATSKFTANQSGDSTLTFASGTTAGTIKVDGTEVAVAGWSDISTHNKYFHTETLNVTDGITRFLKISFSGRVGRASAIVLIGANNENASSAFRLSWFYDGTNDIGSFGRELFSTGDVNKKPLVYYDSNSFYIGLSDAGKWGATISVMLACENPQNVSYSTVTRADATGSGKTNLPLTWHAIYSNSVAELVMDTTIGSAANTLYII